MSATNRHLRKPWYFYMDSLLLFNLISIPIVI